MKQNKKKKPLMITILIILLVLLSYIINVTTINYCMLLVFLIIVLCWVEWKRIKIEIDSFFNVDNLGETEFDETKKVMKFLVFSFFSFFMIFTLIFGISSNKMFTIVTNGSTVILTVFYISLIDVFFESYIYGKIINKETKEIEEKIKKDLRNIKMTSGVFIFIMLFTFLIGNILNQLLNEIKFKDQLKSNIQYNDDRSKIDTKKSYIELKNKTKYKLIESE
ncbi:hypothetical protein [Staphylococcus epidermidis]|uniref:hypothetical protein n=1 Tax=Staphylococcus epidermidis TaxID=1282 RepID=UPI001D262987|nr:hypothetical protein [Staphylococcus epidermidis]MBM6371314.1 hypothetical protein [Staphylococcus epidermidis]MCO6331329.1 hypothetical protein [Staphylococcus epidermidis]UXS06836.1 hypothetical protein MUA70_11685 [Staphylococcus epidermidis]